MNDKSRKHLVGVVTLAAGLLSVFGFYDVGRQWGQYRLDYAMVFSLPPSELNFFVWYLAFGVLATLSFTVSYVCLSGGETVDRAFERLFSWKFFLPCALIMLAAETLAFQRWVLQYAQITDDEATYVFIAQTLLKGRVANPSPGDIEFFRNQFVILSPSTWYGKYPIGHPAFLALGEAIGLRFLVVPVLNCLLMFVTYRVGRRLFPDRGASLAVLLLLLSPHFVFMGASQLSHTTESLCMMGGFLALLLLREQDRLAWSLAAGVCFSAAILVRPLPGVLFLPVAAAWVWFALKHLAPKRRVTHLLAGIAPIAVAGGILLAVNLLQTGDPMKSGYDQFHKVTYFQPFELDKGKISYSLVGSVLRENFWLFGWPLSLAFVALARATPGFGLLWGLAGAILCYRVILPKTGVATLGPVYLTEMLPLLALASASGIQRIRGMAGKLFPGAGKRAISGFLVGSTLTALLCFLPIVIKNIHRSSKSRQQVFRLVEQKTSGKVLIFTTSIVEVNRYSTWAYYPPNPSPDLDDKAIFVRMSPVPARNFEFWKRRFPDRTAWVFWPERPVGADFVEVRSAWDFAGLPAR